MSALELILPFWGRAASQSLLWKKHLGHPPLLFSSFYKIFQGSPFLSLSAIFSPLLDFPTALELDRLKQAHLILFPGGGKEGIKLAHLLREQMWLLMDGSDSEAKKVHKKWDM